MDQLHRETATHDDSLNTTEQSVLGEMKKASVPNIEQFAVSVEMRKRLLGRDQER